MASQQTYRQAIAATIGSAIVDRERAGAERVLFKPDALARITLLFSELGGPEKTKQAWRETLDEVLADPMDVEKALALYYLRDRLIGSVDRIYDETPDGLRRRSVAPQTPEEVQAEDLSWSYPPGL